VRMVRILLSAMLLVGLAGGAERASAAEQRRPNIVLMLSDNLGYGDLGVYGGGMLRGAATPRLDRLAAEGIRFTNFNVEAECTPSRSALMTGRHPIRSGTNRAAPPGLPNGLAPWEYTLAELLADAGYATAIFGKWHLGDSDGRFPTDQGFDEWWGFPFSTDVASHASSVGFDPEIVEIPRLYAGKKGEKVRKLAPYDLGNRPLVDAEIAERSVAYIHERAGSQQPFFLFVSWSLVHHPVIPHPDFDGRTGRGPFADVLAEHDHRVGQVLDAIDAAGVREDTLVVYASDNGPDVHAHPWTGSPGPFRGQLGTVREGAIRAPMMIRWPDRTQAGRVTNEIVALVDLYPTLASIAGADLPDDRGLDGLDQRAFLVGEREESAREAVLFFWSNKLAAVKWRQFKIHFIGDDPGRRERVVDELWAPRVYNIEQDQREEHDLLRDYLWIFRPAMQTLIPFIFSLEEHGVIEPGGSERKPFRGRVEFPFIPEGQLDDMLSSIRWMVIKHTLKEYAPFLPFEDPMKSTAPDLESRDAE
jgi:arylsulfatase A-like enzyme